MIAAFVTRWDVFFHRTVPPHLLAILRISFGLFLMLYWYTQWVQAPLFSSEQGLTVPLYRIDLPLFLFLFHPPLWFVQSFFVCVFLALFTFTLGLLTRTSALLLLVLFLYFHCLTQYLFSTSFYRLYGFALLVFLLPGADRTFSVQMLLERGSFLAWEPISILPQRLLALQVSFTYFGVGWQKLYLPDWQSGAILRNGFMGRWATACAFFFARLLPPAAFDWMVATVKVFECSLPFGLWSRRFRGWFFVGGFLFHTLVTLTLSIWWFQVLVPLYIVFLTPEEVYEAVKRVSGGSPLFQKNRASFSAAVEKDRG